MDLPVHIDGRIPAFEGYRLLATVGAALSLEGTESEAEASPTVILTVLDLPIKVLSLLHIRCIVRPAHARLPSLTGGHRIATR